MSKAILGAVIGVVALILCCCLCCGALYFTGSLSEWSDWDIETDYDDDLDDWDELSDELEDIEDSINDMDDNGGSSSSSQRDTKTYTGDDFSFNYPDTWTASGSDTHLSLKPATGSENVNIIISLNKSNDMKYPTQAQCETLMKAALDYVEEEFTITNYPKTSYTETYYPGCKTLNAELKPDTGDPLEQEYHVLVNTEDRNESLSIILTTSIDQTINYYPEMRTIMSSLEF
jgi:hypothetical protein